MNTKRLTKTRVMAKMAQRKKKHVIIKKKKGPAARSRRYEIHNILNTHTHRLPCMELCVSVFDPFANRERERERPQMIVV
jgi:hypothetical protein